MLSLIGDPPVTGVDLLRFLKTKSSHPELELILKAYYDITRELAERPGYPRLNPVPFVLQAMLETDYLKSWWFVAHFNLAGIGVTGVTAKGPEFLRPPAVMGTTWQYDFGERTWKQGLRFSGYIPAVYAHLFHALAYCKPTVNYGQPADFFNNRYFLALGTRSGKPAATVLTDFNNAWAKTSDYGQRIEKLWEDYLAHAVRKAFSNV